MRFMFYVLVPVILRRKIKKMMYGFRLLYFFFFNFNSFFKLFFLGGEVSWFSGRLGDD